MNAEVNALLVFCEGPHDSEFVKMVMKELMEYKPAPIKFSEMPSPFNNLFRRAVEKHTANDMSLGMAHKFFLPDAVLYREGNYVFIYNSGGKDQYEKLRKLLSDYLTLFENPSFSGEAESIVKSSKYLFIYDADTEGIQAVLQNMNNEFNKKWDRGLNRVPPCV